jgi:hypothetical protein
LIGIQIGNEFHNRKVFKWRTQHAGKPFWDTARVNSSNISIEEIDKIVAPQFPMLGSNAPDYLKFTVDDWLKVTDRVIQLVGDDHVILGDRFRRRPYSSSPDARHPRCSAYHRGHAPPRLFRKNASGRSWEEISFAYSGTLQINSEFMHAQSRSLRSGR